MGDTKVSRWAMASAERQGSQRYRRGVSTLHQGTANRQGYGLSCNAGAQVNGKTKNL